VSRLVAIGGVDGLAGDPVRLRPARVARATYALLVALLSATACAGGVVERR
jgi:hypothetical protein